MHIVSQILFILLVLVSLYLFYRKAKEIRQNILLGREEEISDEPGKRWKNVLLLALGQKKMFRNPLVAVLHLLIYFGFIIINIEVLEIALDGLFGRHRLFSGAMGGFYPLFIDSFEILALLVLLSCVVFLARRNVVYIRRLRSKELAGWPRSDANYILITEIVLMTLFLTMNAADTTLQTRGYGEYGLTKTGNFLVSSFLQPLFMNTSDGTLVIIERTCWWLHIIGIFAFLNYLPYSKHLHIVLAFPNTYFGRLIPQGKMHNMPEIQNEVLYAMQPELAPTTETVAETKKFGAKDIFDLSWRNLMEAYSCTECGRCTAACPANITGKKLSPRKIMMDTRDRMEEVRGNLKQKNSFVDDNKSLLHNYITEEELRACTTCQACVQECPVSISPLDIIVQLRRYLIMEESNAPQEWNGMFNSTENNFAPWKFSPEERDKWAEA